MRVESASSERRAASSGEISVRKFLACYSLACCLLAWTGCATKVVVKPGFDFSKIHRVAVLPFEGPGGPTVTNEFVRQLLASGLDVADRARGVDAVLSGTVIDYRPNNPLMVFLGLASIPVPGSQPVVVTNPVVSAGGIQVTPKGTAFGLPNAQMVTVNVSVGIHARLSDSASGRAVWAQDYSYEALDAQGAIQAVASTLVKSLR